MMLTKSKFRKKAQRIAVCEIMIPLILLIVLGMTVIIFLLKIFRIKSESELEDLTMTSYKDDQHIEAEVRWVINLGMVMLYGLSDLLSSYWIYTGIKERSYWKCRLWVCIQMGVLVLFTVSVIKRSNDVSGGFHFFEFIALCVSIYIYKIHHVSFVYGLVGGLKEVRIRGQKQQRKTRKTTEIQVQADDHMADEPEVISRLTSL